MLLTKLLLSKSSWLPGNIVFSSNSHFHYERSIQASLEIEMNQAFDSALVGRGQKSKAVGGKERNLAVV